MSAPAIPARSGDTLTWRFTVTSDITGWTPTWTADALNGSLLATATTGSGLVSTPGATSYVDLTVTAAATALWAAGVYRWDLRLASGGQVRAVEWDTAGTTVGTLTVESIP